MDFITLTLLPLNPWYQKIQELKKTTMLGIYENMAKFLTIQKSLIKIWLGFLREDYHIKFYYLMLHHILSHYI